MNPVDIFFICICLLIILIVLIVTHYKTKKDRLYKRNIQIGQTIIYTFIKEKDINEDQVFDISPNGKLIKTGSLMQWLPLNRIIILDIKKESK